MKDYAAHVFRQSVSVFIEYKCVPVGSKKGHKKRTRSRVLFYTFTVR